MSHTQGPWICDNEKDMFDTDERTWVVTSADGIFLAAGIPWEREADARLIAAAPELLEALRAGMQWSEDDGYEDEHCMVSDGERAFRIAARAAIAKAEGKESE